MSADAQHLRVKTWICATVVVLCNVFGNYFLKLGMPADLPAPIDYITALFRPAVALGVVLLITWLVSRMTLLSWADLSYVLPVTSIGYVLVALLGKLLLNEVVSPRRWCGILLIVGGVAMVGLGSAVRTHSVAERPR